MAHTMTEPLSSSGPLDGVRLEVTAVRRAFWQDSTSVGRQVMALCDCYEALVNALEPPANRPRRESKP